MFIIVGVSGVVVVLIAATTVIAISVTLCLRKRKKNRIVLTDNVSYCVCNDIEMSPNAAYTSHTALQNKAYTYDYADMTGINITTITNEAYAYVERNGNISLSHNQAYGMVQQ